MNIRQVRKKIKSVTNVKKITRAMQLVSAVKMKKFQQLALEAQPYQMALTGMIKKISTQGGAAQSVYHATKTTSSGSRTLVIVIATNKGLCGGFNMHLFRHLLTTVDLPRTDFACMGRRGSEFLARTGSKVIADYSTSEDTDVAAALFDAASQGFFEGKYSEIGIFYNKFVSPIRFEPTYEVLLPLSLPEDEVHTKAAGEYLIEPSPDAILDELFRSYLEQKIRYALIQHEAGEHSARMMAMKLATDNATELTYSLTQIRNKIRQQNITYELLDMVTAQAVA